MSNLDNLVNTYEGYPGLSELEAELLWEYAKTAALIKDVSLIRQITTRFWSETHTQITAATRALVQHSQQSISSDERRAIDDKIALVFTLV